MRARFWPLWAILFSVVAGYDSGVYSATPSKEGSVIVINRFTGTVQKVDGEKLVELHESHEVPSGEYKPSLPTASIPKQPIRIDASVKYRDGMMVMVHVRPDETIKSELDWTFWRAHTSGFQSSATLNLQFMDRDGFLVVAHELPYSDLTRTVNFEGNATAFQTQITIPLTRAAYSEITSWQVGWGGYWPAYTPPATEDHPAKKGT